MMSRDLMKKVEKDSKKTATENQTKRDLKKGKMVVLLGVLGGAALVYFGGKLAKKIEPKEEDDFELDIEVDVKEDEEPKELDN